MSDSADAGLQVADSTPIDPSVSGSVLDLNVPASFFENPDLVYPVIVDPAVSLDPTFDTYVSSAATSTDFQSSTELLVGTPDSGASKYRSFLTFDSSQWNHQDIISASMKLYETWAWSCTAKQFTVYPAATASGATRWGSQPTTYLTDYQSTVAAAGYNSSCAAKYVTANVTTPVTYLAPTIANRAGFAIRASETDSTGWKRFSSSNASTNKPVLTVTYNHYPNTATQPVVDGLAANGAVNLVGSTKPLLSSSAVDPDGSNVTLTFGVYASASSSYPASVLCQVTVASGAVGSCYPAAALVANQSYVVKVVASDSRVDSLNPSPETVFTISNDLPATPQILCPGYSTNYVSATVPASDVVCTVTTPASATNPVKQVTITLDDSAPVIFAANTDGSSSNQVILKAGSYQHNLNVVATSVTGIQSAPATFVTTFGVKGVITPQSPTTVRDNITISTFALPYSYYQPSTANVQYRVFGSTGSWSQIESGLPLTSRGGVFGLYDHTFNLAAAAGIVSMVPTTLQLRVCYDYQPSNFQMCTDDSSMTATVLPVFSFGGPQAAAGPGHVSLHTGDFGLNETDFTQSLGGDSVSVGRSFSNKNTGDSIFGPGWASSIGGDSTSVSGFNLEPVDALNSLVYVTNPTGDLLTFKKTSSGTFDPFDYSAKASNLILQKTGNNFVVSEPDGSQTTFGQQAGAWVVTAARSGTNGKQVVTSYNTDGTINHIGYQAATTTCNNPSTDVQGVYFNYTTINQQTRLASVSYTGCNTATHAWVIKTVAQYSYNSQGRLVQEVDPKNSQATSYEYDSNNRITKTVTNGFVPYLFKYDTVGRLVQVQREQYFLFLPANTVNATFVYDTARTSSSTAYPNLSATVTSHWGQTTAPTYAAAVFDNQTPIGFSNNTLETIPVTDTRWRLAKFYFTNSTGTTTNTATYGKTHWLYTANMIPVNVQAEKQISYASYDSQGIENVLNRFNLEGNDNFDETQHATIQKYATSINNIDVPDGVYLTDVWSPIHTATLTDGSTAQVRNHVVTTYDEGAPTAKVYGLPTTQSVYSAQGNTQTLLTKTVTNYNPIDAASSTGPTSGWILGQATKVTQFDPAGNLVSQAQTLYNNLGQVTKTVQPGSNGNDGRTELTTYYTSTNQTTHPGCGNHPEWETLVCFTEYPVTPLIPNTYVQSYDWQLNPLVEIEKTATTITRTTTNTYLDDGRLNTQTVQATGLQTFVTTNTYDPTTLQQTGTSQTVDGVTNSQTTSTYDAFGRQTSYTNTLGDTETTTYVPEGQLAAGSVASTTNPAGTTTYTYGGNDPRPVATGMTFQNNGQTPFTYTYQATYDELGKQVDQTGPIGMYQKFGYNDANQITAMTYGQTIAGTSNDWYTWTRNYDIYGRVLKETEPDPATTATTTKQNNYTYDQSGRLTSTTTNSAAGCNLNSYTYDTAGNRLSKTTGVCGAGTTTNHTYNSFSQLTSTGYQYDALGRNTLIPSADTPNGGNAITLAYNTNDQVTQISQAGATTNFSYEAEGRRLTETSGTQITTRHYTDGSDNPTWSTQATTAAPNTVTKTEIYTPSLGTGLNITTTIQAGVATGSMQLHDLRGNTVSTIDLTTNTATGWCSYDEFGNQEGSNPANTANINYTTYGQAERATNATALILMGARVYNPETNQFTSPDPVKGGNENSYTYPNDPVNFQDFAGLMSWWMSLALSVALDLAIDAAVGMTAMAGGVGILILAVKGAIVSFIVSIVEMVVDHDFSVRAWARLSQNFMLALVLPPYISKMFKGLKLDKVLKGFFRWIQGVITSVLDSVCGMVVEQTVAFVQTGPDNSKSLNNKQSSLPIKKELISSRP
ncbi:MAG: DNRLRE domain-containing protein [Rhodoluna sp.]|nr:DNRLRE domain-containing protein [Rhodoluna sp.]